MEWLETNGTGAFAMGTVAGVNTRRYHGLLVASLNPPVERNVLLARVEEEITADGATHNLGACQYPGIVTPRGFELLDDFRIDPCATWIYECGSVHIEKQVFLVDGRQAVVIRYRADANVAISVRLFTAYRDYHSLRSASQDPYGALPPLHYQHAGRFEESTSWYYKNEYLRELDRGMDFREDLYSPGVIHLDLAAGVWNPICASLDGTPAPSSEPEARRDPFIVQRADGTPTIMAGYPWFTDWGRDTMIAIPGLLLIAGRLGEVQSMLAGFLRHRKQGLIPNRFPDDGGEPEYNTVDATLWMFQTMRQWLAAGGDQAFLRDVFYPAVKDIISWHQRGTMFGIRVDPEDRLLSAGSPGTQLTWMDAKVGDCVVTPRHGKPVEINALWHGALCLAADWGTQLGDPQGEAFRLEASIVRQSFREKFWNAESDSLYDVIAPDGPVAKVRPNQIFAVSLPFPLLDTEAQISVVRAVERELLTPVGLRTLSPADADYKPCYAGTPAERDQAYHQGTVWPWLLGPFVDAYLIAFGTNEQSLAYCRQLLEQFDSVTELDGCLGSIPEVYDGSEPRHFGGCPAQAWSVAEIARLHARLRG